MKTCFIEKDKFEIREKNKKNPYNYEDIFSKVCDLLQIQKIVSNSFIKYINHLDIYITLAPTYRILLCYLLRKKIIFVNFQYLRKNDSFFNLLKNIKLVFYIFISDVVISQDPRVKKVLGKNLTYIPKHIDLNYFVPSKKSYKKIFDVVIPGDAERNLNFYLDLKKESKKVAVITRNIIKDKNNDIAYFQNVTNSKYKKILLQSKIGILPMNSSSHLAGQTALLELLACKVPVFISPGFTYELYKNYLNVYKLDNFLVKKVKFNYLRCPKLAVHSVSNNVSAYTKIFRKLLDS
jgi:hypothetical protein